MDNIKTLTLYKFSFDNFSLYHQFYDSYEICASMIIQYRSLTALYILESSQKKLPIDVYFSIYPGQEHYFKDIIENFKGIELIVKSSTDQIPMENSAQFKQ